MAAIHAYVETARRKSGLGKVALAERIGVDYDTMRRWLTGEVPQTVRAMVELVNLAGDDAEVAPDSIVLTEILDNTREIKAALASGKFMLTGELKTAPLDPSRKPLPDTVLDALTAEGQKKLSTNNSSKSKKVAGDDQRSVG